MERMQKVFEDLIVELKKMGADEERAEAIANGLAEELFFSITGMSTSDERMKKNIITDARQKAVLYLRAVSITGIDKFDPEKISYNGVLDSEELFDSFSDVSWGMDDDDDDWDDDDDDWDDDDDEDDED